MLALLMRSFELFVTALAWLASAIFVLAGIMLTFEVIARYFFTAPTIWAAELSQICLIWGTLIAMAWCLRERRHVRIDALTARLSPLGRLVAEIAAMVTVAAFSGIVVWYGWEIFWDSFQRGRTTGSMLDLPTWISELAVPFGFSVLFIQALIEVTRVARGELTAGNAARE